jgi:hypothetical protein
VPAAARWPPRAAIREGQRDHLGQFKETFAKAEAIRVELGRDSSLRQQDAHGVMSQVDPVELLAYSLRRLGAQDLALSSLVRFDLIDDQLDFPALMIQGDQLACRSHPRIE